MCTTSFFAYSILYSQKWEEDKFDFETDFSYSHDLWMIGPIAGIIKMTSRIKKHTDGLYQYVYVWEKELELDKFWKYQHLLLDVECPQSYGYKFLEMISYIEFLPSNPPCF